MPCFTPIAAETVPGKGVKADCMAQRVEFSELSVAKKAGKLVAAVLQIVKENV